MADNLGYTPGAGATIRTNQGAVSGAHMQIIKMAISANGAEDFIPSTVADGLLVKVSSITGSVTVSAAAAAPLAIRLSTGAAFIDTFPVSIAGTVTVTGTVALSGTSPVSGTVTANQGTAAAIGSAWNVKVGDGANPVGVTTVGGSFALKVDVIKQTGGGVSQQDRTAFTDGTTFADVSGGVFNDAMTSPGAGQSGYVRITSFRAFHVNIRKNDGTELGIAATPLRVDPTGTTTQPVSGTVTVNQGATAWVTNITQIAGHAVVEAAAGIAKVGISDATGAAFSAALGVTAANALPVQAQPTITGAWRVRIAYSTLTDQALHTPAGGKTAFIEGIIITPTAAGALLKIHDGADASALYFYYGQPPLGSIVITPARPLALSAINNVLRWTAGATAAGDVVVWGYDA